MAVVVAVTMTVVMFMMVVMPAATTRRVLVIVVAPMVGVSVLMVVIMLAAMIVVMAMIVAAAGVDSGALGIESPLRRAHGAAKAADGFGKGGVGQDIQRICSGLRHGVPPASQQRRPQQSRRIFRAHLKHRFQSGAHQNEIAVLQLQRVAVIGDARGGQRQINGEAAIGAQRGRRVRQQFAGAMVKGDGVDDAVGFDGGAAGERCGA